MSMAAGEKGVLGLDFDGCIAYGANAKIRFAKETWGLELAIEQTTEEVFPLGPQRYRQMMDIVARKLDEYELAPYCKEVLEGLAKADLGLAVVTSRYDYELEAAKWFIKNHRLPISDIRNTKGGGKRATCNEVGAVAFLEDSLWKLVELKDTGIALYFMKQGWNVHEQPKASQLEFVVSVNDWQHFYSHVTGTDLAAARVVNHA